ncbi:hypothetical protein COV24_02795 [candidate division WWE3 bacterium CG10_big_fil_rev_8_21_14_0_10_32_10]|uniref:EamA domain-containing protein n=1 Tax=candidate division WWE3 bacterium CG10_big_fil_rev_8_21_14_0_10_32_10 TaxID=1975090 RepID=A0A2H0RBP1_UNCKA|nr:MAG: hypothetical protein COV24_02795 [candidate division WWE3 bacterium CG10_big_fil_rev_8_21_14_0_10_32_10]
MKINKGILFAIVTTIISGISIFINKFVVSSVNSPLVFTTTKNTIVGLLILFFVLSTGKYKKIKDLNKDQLIKLGLVGIIGGSLPFYLFFEGLSRIPAINAAIIQKTLVFWVAILAFVFLKERISKTQVVGLVFLLAANLFIGGFKGFSLSIGELLVLMATILWSVETIIAKKVLKKVDSNLVTLARMTFGALILLTFTTTTSFSDLIEVFSLTSMQLFWISVTSFSLFAYVISWYKALSKAPAITVTSILAASPLITNLLSVIFITHTPGALLSTQTALLLMGTMIFIVSSKKHKTNRLVQEI